MKLQKKASRNHLAVTALTPEVIRHVIMSNPALSGYTFLCLVKHPPYARSRSSRRILRKSQAIRLREIVTGELAHDLFGHIDWASLAVELVRYEAARRYVEKKYPAPSLRRRK
jgi:hypothetical protein